MDWFDMLVTVAGILHRVIEYKNQGFLFILYVDTLNYMFYFCCRTSDENVVSVWMRIIHCRRDHWHVRYCSVWLLYNRLHASQVMFYMYLTITNIVWKTDNVPNILVEDFRHKLTHKTPRQKLHIKLTCSLHSILPQVRLIVTYSHNQRLGISLKCNFTLHMSYSVSIIFRKW